MYIEQDSFRSLILWTGLAFLLYFYMLKSAQLDSRLVYKFIWIAIIARILLIYGLPLLSDDVYRFIWDGILWHEGINPLIDTPRQLMESGMVEGAHYEVLLLSMNSPDYHTIYPPIHQFIFYLGTFSYSNIGAATLMRAIIILSEVCTLFVLIKLFKTLQ